MSNDVDYIANSLLSDYSTNQKLKRAVENGARSIVKGIVNDFINENVPSLSGAAWLINLVIDFIFDYFGW